MKSVPLIGKVSAAVSAVGSVAVAISALQRVTATTLECRARRLRDLCPGAALSSARFGQLAGDSPVECRIRRLALLFKRQGRQLDGVKNVAEVELGQSSYRFVVSHPPAPGARASRLRS